MVSKQKIKLASEVDNQMKDYSVVGLLDMHKLPARNLHEIRNKLRGKAVIRMVKKRIITRVLEQHKLQALLPYVQGEPALFLTKENPFRMAKILDSSKSEAAAKPGDIAPKDIMVKAGPTSLPPGPAIGEFQKAKIPAGVAGDKIEIKKDTVVVKQGEVVEEHVAAILSKLGVTPMEIGLNLLAVYENGTVYTQDVLFVPQSVYDARLNEAITHALNMSVFINYPTPQNVKLLIGKAHREAKSVATKGNLLTPANLGDVLAKATREAQVVEGKLKKSS